MSQYSSLKYSFLVGCWCFSCAWLVMYGQYQMSYQKSKSRETVNGKRVVTGQQDLDPELFIRFLENDAGPRISNATSEHLVVMDDNTSETFETVTYNFMTTEDPMEIELDTTQQSANITATFRRYKNYKCPIRMKLKNGYSKRICGDIKSIQYKLIFFTTMFYSNQKVNFFNNTLRIISSMQNDFNIKPVLFLDSLNSFIKANQTEFLEYACELGWTVLLAPHCNKFGFPVFKNMFNVTMEMWNADWYGYSNGDMLFDGSLVSTLDFVQSQSELLQIPMLVGRRYMLPLDVTRELQHYSEVTELHFNSKLDNAAAVDYFMTRKGAFPWEQVPDFVVGRPVYDTWIIWFAQHDKLPIVDTTATVRAIHQSIKGLSKENNTHKTHRVNDGMDWNDNLTNSLQTNVSGIKFQKRFGYISCLSLKLIKMNRKILKYMVDNGNRTIVGRGRDHHPVEADDEEYLHAIRLFLGQNDTDLNQTDLNHTSERDSFIFLPEYSNDFRNKTSAIILNTTIPQQLTKISRELLSIQKGNGTANQTKTEPSKKQLRREILKLNKEKGYKDPAMIPYICESSDCVYVLVRRKSYLEWRTYRPGFKAVPYLRRCSRKQNIDRELAEPVTF